MTEQKKDEPHTGSGNNNFVSYLANAVAAIATATAIMSLTALNNGSQEIARLQEQIKSAKEQLTTIQDFLQKDRADSYTRTEAIKDFSLRDQMIQRLDAKVEAELDTLRAKPGSRE